MVEGVHANRPGREFALALLLGALAGCGSPTPTLESLLPTPTKARSATVEALNAWRAGQPAGPLGTADAPIQVVDTHRPAGRPLMGFEILGNVALEGSRQVTARVRLGGSEEEETALVRYQVFGVRPLWVVRQEDLEMLGHWDHPMTAPAEAVVEAPNPEPAGKGGDRATKP